eukprot:TRINITY_DN505_c1_g1_i1.p1 TRINITY_DN505_c1_g1~~TRINITY_DN505_c1_g1_i1.p1  ORF type:complete len:241 (+),score=12.20 TRINITY_DN505_c1_g1_i1:216-938(+)
MRFPVLLPPGLKYGTFSGHAVLFIVDESVWGSTHSRALQRWGRLKSKIRSIALWSGLRGDEHARTSLSRAFGRSPPMCILPVPESSPRLSLEELTLGKQMGSTASNTDSANSSAPKSGVSTPWRETWNEEYQRPYYWNKETGVRCWKEPQELKDFKAASEANSSPRKIQKPTGKQPQQLVTKADVQKIIREELIRAATPPRTRGRGMPIGHPYSGHPLLGSNNPPVQVGDRFSGLQYSRH